MGNGYLGKISAIVTANTSDVKPKLDAAASDVTKFAKTVQSTLTSASSGASKAFEGIYTPLQKLERGLAAASSMKLSFKGFEGALRDVDGLKARLASLAKRNIEVNVSGTGFSKVSELRDAISKITSKDIALVVSMGGLDLARQNLGALLKDEVEVLAKFEKLQSLDQITVAVEVIGQASLDATTLKMRQTAAAAKLIAEPLNEAARVAATLGLAMQQNVSAAMAQVQARAEAVKASLGTVGAGSQFGSMAREARGLLAVLRQLAEAQAAVGGVRTGRELAFANPRLAAQLESARAVTGRAAGQPAAFLQGAPDVGRLTQRINRNAERASEAYSGVVGATTDAGRASAEARLARVQKVLDGLIAKLSQKLPLDIDTGPAKAKISDIESHLVGLSSRRVTNLPPNFFRDRLAEQSRKRDDEIDATKDRFSRRATILPPNYIPDKFRENEDKRFKGMFGDSPDSSAARVGDLTSKVRSLQSAMSELPVPVVAKLIPALERAKQAVFALGNNPTASQLAKAAAEASNLERNLKRAQVAAQFRGNFGSFLNSAAISGYSSQLNTIRQGMAAVGATASGPVATAIGKYQKALMDSAKAGTLATSTTKKDLDALLNKIAQVAVAEKLMTKKQATGFVQNVQRSGMGDVGRNGLMNFNLAMGQAAFAVDDFMSSTGGLDQKLRAISNNLTQMAFILGGTTGLWIGVAAVLATTLAIPLLKATFQFEDMEAKAKGLNAELEKSRNIAERTADAYKELAKALRESGVGGPAGKVAGFAGERRREAKERAEAIVFGGNSQYARMAGSIEEKKATLEKTTDLGDRAVLVREIEALTQSQQRLRSGGIAPSSSSDLARMLSDARRVEVDALRTSSGPEVDRLLEDARKREGAAPRTPQESMEAVDSQLSGLRSALKNMPIADYIGQNIWEPLLYFIDEEGQELVKKTKGIREQVAKLEEERAKLEQDAALRRNERFIPRAMAAAAAAELTPGVRDRVAGLGLGSNVTSQFESQIAGVSKEFADIIVELEKATRTGADTTDLEKAADLAAEALQFLYEEADRFARDVALGSLIPTKARLERSAEQLAGVGPSNIATDIARVQAKRQTLEEERSRAQARGDEFGVNQADFGLTRLDSVATQLDSAAIAVAAFEKAVNEAAGGLAKVLLEEAKSREQELRRAANRGVEGAAGAFGGAAAEARALEQRGRGLRKQLNRERLKFEDEYKTNPELQALADRVRVGRDQAGNLGLSAAQQEAGRIDAEEAQAELDRRFERRAAVVAARGAVDAADSVSSRERRRIERANDQAGKAAGGMSAAVNRNVSAASEFGPKSLGEALDLQARMDEMRKNMEEALAAGIENPFADMMEDLRGEIEAMNEQFADTAVTKAKRRSVTTEGRLDSARNNLQGVGISDVQGRITEIEVRRRDLERRRDEAIQEGTPEGRERAVEFQEQINAQNALAREAQAAAVAVGGFQEAINKAALTLQGMVSGEAGGRAMDARRRANEAEAIFGAGSPEANRARGQQDRAEKAMQDAEDERRRAEDAMNMERAKFEDEIASGANPAAADRAQEIADLEARAANEDRSAADRATAKAEADRLRAEQRREFESRPEVEAERRKADKADKEMQKRQSIERGLEMGRTEDEKRKEEVRRQAADLGNAATELRDTGRGGEVRGLARNAAMNMAKDAAPLYAQLTEEVMTARLQGPSRAALNVSDISTSQGASELNRLIRGDDSARDVNLAEMKKQSNLLEAIEKAILDSTGVVVNL